MTSGLVRSKKTCGLRRCRAPSRGLAILSKADWNAENAADEMVFAHEEKRVRRGAHPDVAGLFRADDGSPRQKARPQARTDRAGAVSIHSRKATFAHPERRNQ